MLSGPSAPFPDLKHRVRKRRTGVLAVSYMARGFDVHRRCRIRVWGRWWKQRRDPRGPADRHNSRHRLKHRATIAHPDAANHSDFRASVAEKRSIVYRRWV